MSRFPTLGVTRNMLSWSVDIALLAICFATGLQLFNSHVATLDSLSAVPKIGSTFTVPGVAPAGGKPTLVLAVSESCRFCTASMPFYRRLQGELVGRNHVQLVVVSPTGPAETEQYLTKHGVTAGRIVQASFGALGLGGSPTLVLLGPDGIVRGAWAGLLNGDSETAVIDALRAQ
jgi:hypothetical protein